MRAGDSVVNKFLGTNISTKPVTYATLADIISVIYIEPARSKTDLDKVEKTIKGKLFWPSEHYSKDGKYQLYVSHFKRGLVTHRTVWVKDCITEEIWEWKGYTLGPIKNAVIQKIKEKRLEGFQVRSNTNVKEEKEEMDNNSLRKCPYCAELIKSSERVCPICSSVLDAEVKDSNQKTNQAEKNIDILLNREGLNSSKKSIQKIVSREKTLSSDVQKEYIHYFIKIKEWMAVGIALVGALLGILSGNILEFDTLGIIISLFVGLVIGAIVGLNYVGSALMQAITAEQGVVTEELLTEILAELESEE